VQVAPDERDQYDKMAAEDRARFVRESAAFEDAVDAQEVAMAAAREAAEQAEWAAVQEQDAARVRKAEADRAHKGEQAHLTDSVWLVLNLQRHRVESHAAEEGPQAVTHRTEPLRPQRRDEDPDGEPGAQASSHGVHHAARRSAAPVCAAGTAHPPLLHNTLQGNYVHPGYYWVGVHTQM
jgi:hypothetical protein